MVLNVAEDEENPIGVPDGDVVEWNIIDNNYIQYDYPTATKILPAEGANVVKTLKEVIKQQRLFEGDKFGYLRNPLTSLMQNLENIQDVTGSVNPTLTARIYEILSACGIEVFCATSEN